MHMEENMKKPIIGLVGGVIIDQGGLFPDMNDPMSTAIMSGCCGSRRCAPDSTPDFRS